MMQSDKYIFDLWQKLSKARVEALDFAAPWESQNPTVKAAWAELIVPANLPDLKSWLQNAGPMNPAANKAALVAIEQCSLQKETEETQKRSVDG
jgi:hypothetical protein